MARGFESKDVEFQQAEAAARKEPLRAPMSPEDRDAVDRRRTLELMRTRVLDELRAAPATARRQALQTALAEIEAELLAGRQS